MYANRVGSCCIHEICYDIIGKHSRFLLYAAFLGQVSSNIVVCIRRKEIMNYYGAKGVEIGIDSPNVDPAVTKGFSIILFTSLK